MVIKLFDVYYEDEDFVFSTSEIYDEVHLHVTCHNWKLSVLKRMYEVWGQFLREKEDEGVKELYAINPNRKFCELMGGEYHGTFVLRNGLTREAMKWVIQ